MTTEQITTTANDAIFIHAVKEEIDALKEARRKRPDPKPGYRYKRDTYDKMWQEGNLTAHYFLNHIESIWMQKSNLPAKEREFIKGLCYIAFHKAVKIYADAAKEPEAQ